MNEPIAWHEITDPVERERARRRAARLRNIDVERARTARWNEKARAARAAAATPDPLEGTGLRRCTVCTRVLPEDHAHFFRSRRGRNGYAAHCRECDTGKRINQMARRPDYGRRYHLMHTYGITLERYEEILASQGGGCAACGVRPDDRGPLCVDHDHDCCPGAKTCGRCLRGLLCRACNGIEGQIMSGRVSQVLDYLDRWDHDGRDQRIPD